MKAALTARDLGEQGHLDDLSHRADRDRVDLGLELKSEKFLGLFGGDLNGLGDRLGAELLEAADLFVDAVEEGIEESGARHEGPF